MNKRGVRSVFEQLIKDRNPDVLGTLESLGYHYAHLDYNIIIRDDSHNRFAQHCNQMFKYKHWVLTYSNGRPRIYFTYDDDRLMFMMCYGS